MDNLIKHLIRKCDRLYQCARKSNSLDLKSKYKWFRAFAQKVIRDAYWQQISSIFILDNIADPYMPQKNGEMKRFWSFVNSLKKDMSRITSIRENGMQNQMQDKANICNQQFQSAFTSETDDDLPSKSVSLFPAMGHFIVDPVWVAILFHKLNIHKASGPDG